MRPALRRPRSSPLGPHENLFSYLSAVIRYPCGDREMHSTSTLSRGEGIRGYARTHTRTHRERQFCRCLFFFLFFPPPSFFLFLFNLKEWDRAGRGGCPSLPPAPTARSPAARAAPRPRRGQVPATEFGHIPGWQRGSFPRSRSSVPPRSLPSSEESVCCQCSRFELNCWVGARRGAGFRCKFSRLSKRKGGI